jgi:WD40 repeat protein
VFGTFKGDVSVLDLQSQDVVWTGEGMHSSVVNTVDGCGGIGGGAGAREIASASRDGTAKVWDVRQRGPVVTLEPSSTGIECWSVAFGNAYSPTDRNLVVGYANGDTKMLDLRTMKIAWETNVGAGVCHVSFDRKDIQMNKLCVSSLGGKVHVFDLRTFNVQSGFANTVEQVCKSTVWGCYPLPQDRELSMVTTGDGSLYMYRYEYPAVRSEVDDTGLARGVAGKLKCVTTSENTSTQPIVSFDWSCEKRGLFSLTSFDQAVRVGLVLGAS